MKNNLHRKFRKKISKNPPKKPPLKHIVLILDVEQPADAAEAVAALLPAAALHAVASAI